MTCGSRFVRRFAWLATVAVAVPLLAVTAPSGGAVPPAGLPPGLRPTEVNVTNDGSQRWGEPEVAVNPRNPNNLVYIVMSNRATYACEASGDPNCAPANFIGGQPRGFFAVPGFYDQKAFVTFDRGRTWQSVALPEVPVPRGFPREGTDHPNLRTRSDPMVTVDAHGTFYIGWDAIHVDITAPMLVRSAGIAVSRSTDGGRTWSTPVLTGTGFDRPRLTTDLSTGTVYETSSGFVDSALSTANPALPFSPPGQVQDRWVVSSPDGVHWTSPHPLGGGGVAAGQESTISAANGVLGAAFHSTNGAACTFLVGTGAPCTGFETSTNSGTTWTRHVVPGLENTTRPHVAADPAHPRTFTVAALSSTGTALLVAVTHDRGATWSTPATVTDDAGTQKFKDWLTSSPDGVVGMVWRSRTQPGSDLTFPYNVFAATSDDQGATWSDPLMITSTASPGSDPNFTDGGLDDFSWIALSHKDAFIGWGDWRPGDVQGFFSAVKLQAFNH